MVIGELNPGQAKQTDLKGAIRIGLDEALTALEECLTGLTDAQAGGFPLPDRHNITTIVMHLQENLDQYACRFQTGEYGLEHQDQFNMWRFSPKELRQKQKDLPTVAEMIERTHMLRRAAMPGLEAATEDDLLRPRHAEEWWREQDRTAADAYMRTIMHTMAHSRQIWMLRGAMGLSDREGWPEQHWA